MPFVGRNKEISAVWVVDVKRLLLSSREENSVDQRSGRHKDDASCQEFSIPVKVRKRLLSNFPAASAKSRFRFCFVVFFEDFLPSHHPNKHFNYCSLSRVGLLA